MKARRTSVHRARNMQNKIAVTGFEPATSSSLTKRSTKLSHTTTLKMSIA